MDRDDDFTALTDHYLGDLRVHADGRPWVLMNMIASIDGAIEVEGTSGALGNDADFAVFMTLRGLADVVLVGAGTARAEGYKVPNPSSAVREQRAARGQRPRPVIAVVTRSLGLDFAQPLFADPDYRPIVVTVSDADPERLEAADAHADVVLAGAGDVDFGEAVRRLADAVGPVILVEGGPIVNAQVAATDLFDELCVTVSSVLAGGGSGRMLEGGPDHQPLPFELDRAVPGGGLLFTRWLRSR